MFGHQDDSNQNSDNNTVTQDHLTAPLPDSDFNPALPASDADQPSGAPANDFVLPTGASESTETPAADEPVAEPQFAPAATPPAVPVVPEAPQADPVVSRADTTTSDDTNDLLDIKQQALTQLTPLVDQLDQSPEEKFRTTMMMIQAVDNKELVPKAYEAAQGITDEKVKAQALLDIVNEINYFTQH